MPFSLLFIVSVYFQTLVLRSRLRAAWVHKEKSHLRGIAKHSDVSVVTGGKATVDCGGEKKC